MGVNIPHPSLTQGAVLFTSRQATLPGPVLSWESLAEGGLMLPAWIGAQSKLAGGLSPLSSQAYQSWEGMVAMEVSPGGRHR